MITLTFDWHEVLWWLSGAMSGSHLRWSAYEDMVNDERNLMLLCHDCHKEIHCNPWRNAHLMQQKAQELGIDLDERYNRQPLDDNDKTTNV